MTERRAIEDRPRADSPPGGSFRLDPQGPVKTSWHTLFGLLAGAVALTAFYFTAVPSVARVEAIETRVEVVEKSGAAMAGKLETIDGRTKDSAKHLDEVRKDQQYIRARLDVLVEQAASERAPTWPRSVARVQRRYGAQGQRDLAGLAPEPETEVER